jgi:hypothetical protein
MSALEHGVKSFLGPMIRHGQATTLTPPRQKALAAWTFKTALMFEHLQPKDRVIPDAEYEAFYVVKEPPPYQHNIWAAYRRTLVNSGDESFVLMLQEPIGRIVYPKDMADRFIEAHERGCRAYRITFAIGHVVFCVAGHNYPVPVQVTMPTSHVGLRIWKVQGDITWPPAIAVDDDIIGGFVAFHHLFNVPPDGLKPAT